MACAAYLEGAPADVAARLRGVMAIRKDIGILEEEIAALRIRVGNIAHRAGELRRSIKALERVRADDLRKQLVASLTAATTESDTIAKTLGLRTEAMWAQRTRLAEAIRDLTLADRP